MAALKARRRRQLPKSAFAYPSRRTYPIDTPARARNALARASSSRTRGRYSHVAKAVRRKYGSRIKSVSPSQGTTRRPGYRRRKRGKSRRSR